MFQCNLFSDFSVYQERHPQRKQHKNNLLSCPLLPRYHSQEIPARGTLYLSASPKGTVISDKCKETVAFLQYSVWQFSLQPTFLPLISILQGNYKERVMFHCGKREAGKTGVGIASGCSPTPGCPRHWGSTRDSSLRGDKPALATPAAAHPAPCALTQTPPAADHTTAALWANGPSAHHTDSFN